ncbi:MAG: hypothetical protein Q4P24_12095 [Rhodobacterales bacterium]|nr:hypothetical protein [Rhodobacterales bacterium]
MSDIDAMQGRIMTALDRIGQGLAGLTPDTGDTEIEGLRQQLADEQTANAYLEKNAEVLDARATRAEEATRRATAELGAQKAEREASDKKRGEALARLDGELQSLRAANQQLRDNNAALREANAEGVGNADLINQAMAAELEGLRAAHAADRAELDLLLAELDQITARTAHDDAAGSAGATRKEDV